MSAIRYAVESSVAFPEFRVRVSENGCPGPIVASCVTEQAAWAAWRLLHADILLALMREGRPLYTEDRARRAFLDE